MCKHEQISLLNREGVELTALTVGNDWYTGIDRDNDGNVYLACYDKSVYKICAKNKVTKLHTLTFTPLGLAFLRNTRELLICSDNGLIIVKKKWLFGLWGGQEQVLALDVIIKCPRDVASNNIGEICVVDMEQGKAFVFNSSFKCIGTYKGDQALPKEFKPFSVTADTIGNFIIVDRDNHALHVISSSCVPLLTYSTLGESQEAPLYVNVPKYRYLCVVFPQQKSSGKICTYDIAYNWLSQ